MSKEEKTAYKRKFNEENYARIGMYISKEEKEVWSAEAKKTKQSLNNFIRSIVNKYIEDTSYNIIT